MPHGARCPDLGGDRAITEFPALGIPTEEADIRQVMIPFGTSGYSVRYAVVPETEDILAVRVWHGCEARI